MRQAAISEISRRGVLVGSGASLVATIAGACVPQQSLNGGVGQVAAGSSPQPPAGGAPAEQVVGPFAGQHSATAVAEYGPVPGERFPLPAAPLSRIDPAFLRTQVAYARDEKPGTIVVDPGAHYLYLVEEGGTALRYGVGVGKEGFGWSGRAIIHDKQEWPDWYPPKEMVKRQPELEGRLTNLRSGIGVPGGPLNPLGSRAMYLWQNNKDTLYRIHGTNEPWTVGTSMSSGCIRMINQDAIDLYGRTPIGTKVVVLAAAPASVG